MLNVGNELVDVLMFGVNIRALQRSWQKTGLPILVVFDGQAAGAHRDESRQILILRPQSVEHPRAETRTRLDTVSTIHQHQRWFVVGHLGIHRPNDGDIISMLSRSGEQLADRQTGLAVSLKLEW